MDFEEVFNTHDRETWKRYLDLSVSNKAIDQAWDDIGTQVVDNYTKHIYEHFGGDPDDF